MTTSANQNSQTQPSSDALYLKNATQAEVTEWTDNYFTKTRQIVEENGDCIATYAVFMREPVIKATKLVTEWLQELAKNEDFQLEITDCYEEGAGVPATEPMLFIRGSFAHLVETETIFLNKIGAACTAARNARDTVLALPSVPFIAMDARHDAGVEMQEQMAYAAKCGSDAAKKINPEVVGFVGTANNATAKRFFDLKEGLGTMPHAFIGYAKYDLQRKGLLGQKNTLVHAAELYRRRHPEAKFTVLNDYDGFEISDAIAVCKAFPKEATSGELAFRLDTHGGRYLQGLDAQKSYAVIKRVAPEMLKEANDDKTQKILFGKGVSVAAIHHFKQAMIDAGFPNVGVFGSSGFNANKCDVMRRSNAPLSGVGTGSYLPKEWSKTYATADIVAYDDFTSVKVGREALIDAYQNHTQSQSTLNIE